MDDTNISPGDRLRQQRHHLGLTLRECSGRIGCTLTHLHHIEKGRRAPSYLLAWRIEQLTGIPMQAWAPLAEELSAAA